MSNQPPALRAAVTDLERALAGKPAESVPESADATQPSEAAPERDEPDQPSR
jgi:hypothetical protein